jgi:hypothetical protein
MIGWFIQFEEEKLRQAQQQGSTEKAGGSSGA